MEKRFQIKNNAIVMGDFNIPLSQMDRSTTQKIKKEISHLN